MSWCAWVGAGLVGLAVLTVAFLVALWWGVRHES
jgi:hypothetical protein